MNLLNGLFALGIVLEVCAFALVIGSAMAWDAWSDQNDYMRRTNPPTLPAILTGATVAMALAGAFLIGATV